LAFLCPRRPAKEVIVVVGLEELAVDLKTREEHEVPVRGVVTFLKNPKEAVAGGGLNVNGP